MASFSVKSQALRWMHEKYNDWNFILITSCLLNLLDCIEIIFQTEQPERIPAHLQARLYVQVLHYSQFTHT